MSDHPDDAPTLDSDGRPVPGPPRPTDRGTDDADSDGTGDRPAPTLEQTRAGGRTAPVTSGLAGERIGRYQLAVEIGRGGMGVVHEARDPALRRTVAVKRLQAGGDPRRVQAFVDEAQITGQLEHPNIVPVHDTGIDEHGQPWLAMKRIRGRSLSETIADRARRGPRAIDPGEQASILDVITRVAEAVAFAHDRQVIHRDLKPDNVMVGGHGEVLLMDWGLARPLGAADVAPVTTDRRAVTPDLTAEGRVAGTPAFMAPEQADGRTADIGTATDIFGLGAILYHQLTLQPPYTGPNTVAVLTAARQRDLVPPRRRAPHRRIPAELEAIVLRAMAARPEDRYAAANDLVADLAAFRANLPVAAAPPSAWQKLVKWTRRRPAAALAAALSVAFVLVLGLVVALLLAQAAERQRQADVRTARLQAEAAEARAAEREAAEQQFRAEMAARARQGEIHELQQMLGVEATRARDAVLEEWKHLAETVMPRGGGEHQMFLAQLSPARASRYLAAYDRLLEAHEEYGVPMTAGDHYQRGVLMAVAATDFDEALAEIDVALEMDPELAVAWLSRVLFAHMDGRPADELIHCANRAMETAGTPRVRAAALVSRASIKLSHGDPQGARADAERAREVAPEYPDAWTMLGSMELRAGRIDAAEALYDKAVELGPNAVGVWIARAVFQTQAAMLTGDESWLDRAVDDVMAAIEIGPTFSSPLTIRAMVHELRGARFTRDDEAAADRHYGRALRDYRHACALNPTDTTAWVRRASLLARLGRLDEAKESVDRAERYCPPVLRPMVDAVRAEVQAAGD